MRGERHSRDRMVSACRGALAALLVMGIAASGCSGPQTRIAAASRLQLVEPVRQKKQKRRPPTLSTTRTPMLAKTQWDRHPPGASRFVPMGRVRLITVHHEGSPEGNDLTGKDEVRDLIRRTSSYHRNGNGWSDIGYHYVIDRAGRVCHR